MESFASCVADRAAADDLCQAAAAAAAGGDVTDNLVPACLNCLQRLYTVRLCCDALTRGASTPTSAVKRPEGDLGSAAGLCSQIA